jgi:signal peptidase I
MTLPHRAIWFVIAPGLAMRSLLRRHFQFVVVRGESMAPTLSHGDLILGRRRFPKVSRGDIVVFSVYPGDYFSEMTLGSLQRRVKRVVATSGEPAPPSLPASLRCLHDGNVPDRHVALAGDASVSEGSAQFGYIGVDRIESVVVGRIRRGSSLPEPDGVVLADAKAPPR